MKNTLRKRIPLPVVGLLIPLALGMGFFAGYEKSTHQSNDDEHPQLVEQIRQKNYEFARPLLLTNSASRDDSRLSPLKSSVIAYIDSRTQAGVLQSASVYVRILNKGAWVAVNGNEQFSPGSLLKIPLMIYCLKKSQMDSALLSRKLRFDGHHEGRRLPTIVGEPLEAGKEYTVGELLRRMIVFSDNDATIMLDNLFRGNDSEVYADLELPKPDPAADDYFITAEEYSRFFRVLFNATYLNAPLSDYALKIMEQSSFSEGMVQPLGKGIQVPRKFGERETAGVKQFHEFGIVYLENEQYLLGVMTKGRDLNELTNVVSDISEIVYNVLKNAKPNS